MSSLTSIKTARPFVRHLGEALTGLKYIIPNKCPAHKRPPYKCSECLECAKKNISMLECAIKNSHSHCAHYLLEKGSDPTNHYHFLSAIHSSNLIIIELLIKYGAKINSTEYEHERTPLMHAVFTGNLGCVQLLLSYGADPLKIDPSGRTALHYTIQSKANLFEIVKLLCKRTPVTESMIFDSCKAGKMDHLEYLSKYFNYSKVHCVGEIDLTQRTLQTALFISIVHCNMAAVDFLFGKKIGLSSNDMGRAIVMMCNEEVLPVDHKKCFERLMFSDPPLSSAYVNAINQGYYDFASLILRKKPEFVNKPIRYIGNNAKNLICLTFIDYVIRVNPRDDSLIQFLRSLGAKTQKELKEIEKDPSHPNYYEVVHLLSEQIKEHNAIRDGQFYSFFK